MPAAVFDSSAMLALLWEEKGSDAVQAYGDDFIISSVNAAEVFTKLLERGPVEEAKVKIAQLSLSTNIVPFDGDQAVDCSLLRTKTRKRGLSLGERACLALAAREGAVVVTADRAWNGLDLGVEIRLIR